MKHKILYVDDEESNLIIFKNTFRRDFDVITAISAEMALEFLEGNMVEVVITDQRMPGMTGVELLKEINERFFDLPPHRLIVSGYAENEDIKLAFDEFKLSKFISKPWDYNELKLIITNSLENK
jgi:response regulator RpfG family c-di-GMP phosphodiesterase